MNVAVRARERVYAIEAIPLKRMDYGEADRIITLLSDRRGKIRLLARGVRKSRSRMAGHLEPFTLTHVLVARGRDLDLATQAATIEPHREVREDLEKSSLASHLCELVDAFLEDRDEHEDVFYLLKSALGVLGRDEAPPDMIARHFEIRVLGAVGFRPQLDACLKCQAAIAPGRNSHSVALGGVCCPRCAETEPSASPIATDTLKLLRFLQRTGDVRRLNIRVPPVALREAEFVLRGHLEFALERRLRAADFVHHVAETVAGYAP